MNIVLISYDFWGYDGHIIEALRKKGIQAQHIKMTAYRYPNFFARLKNAFSKVFLGKNLKNENRQKLILSTLKQLGQQDQILVINPESIGPKFHEEIKKFTSKYIAFLYDAMARNPADRVLPYFDEVFSFDSTDCEKYGFREITNYNYLPEASFNPKNEVDLMYIGSFDERFQKMYAIAEKLDNWHKRYKFHIIGNKSWKKGFESNKNFIFGTKRIPHAELPDYYKKTLAIMDLVREGQNGLSFRIFEAMALKKKVVTDNAAVKKYDFYRPENILVLGEDRLTKDFFETPYLELPAEIYRKYTVERWVETVFNLCNR